MTKYQKKLIEQKFYDYANLSDGDLWRVVYERTLIKNAFDIGEKLIKLVFVDRRQRYNVCRELKISKANFYYHYSRIIEIAFMFAKDLKLV